MKIKTKLTLGVGLLFSLIFLLAVIGATQIWRLSDDTKNILESNYNSLDYSRRMLDASDKINTDKNAALIFKSNLEKQLNNITETGEKEATENLTAHFEKILKTPTDMSLSVLIRQDLNQIMLLNMDAIQRKSILAEKTADEAAVWVLITGTLCFIIAFILLVNIPGNIANPVRELTEKIKEIADRNYNQRVHFQSSGEFGELADAFNTMAAKLEEYDKSHLSKILFEKKRIDALIEKMHEPIIGLDENRKVLFANGEALKVLNLKKEEIVGKPAGAVERENDLFRALVSELTEQPSAAAAAKTEPLKIFADGRESWFDKEIIRVDITRAGERLARHIGDVIILKNVTAFRELDSAKTNFLSAVSHELKMSVSSILSTLSLMENVPQETPAASQKEHLATLREEGERLLKITDTLTTSSRF